MKAPEYRLDESALAWFYIAPGCEGSDWCRRLLKLAQELLGPEAWIVLQAADEQCEALCHELGLRVIESYLNEASSPLGVSLHLGQTS